MCIFSLLYRSYIYIAKAYAYVSIRFTYTFFSIWFMSIAKIQKKGRRSTRFDWCIRHQHTHAKWDWKIEKKTSRNKELGAKLYPLNWLQYIDSSTHIMFSERKHIGNLDKTHYWSFRLFALTLTLNQMHIGRPNRFNSINEKRIENER